MSASTSPPVSHEPWRLASLWAGLLTGPSAWLVLLQFNYTSSYVACETGRTWFMHLAVVIAALAVMVAGTLAWRARIGTEIGHREPTLPLADSTRIQRTNWMSLAGVLLSAWFVLVILSMEVPMIVLSECQ